MSGCVRWMPGRARFMQGRALGRPAARAGCRAARAGCWAARRPCALHAGTRSLDCALDAGQILQHLRGYVHASWAAVAADNAGHSNMLAIGGTAAASVPATTLWPSCVAAATIFVKPQQRLPGRRAGRAWNIVDNIVQHGKHCDSGRKHFKPKLLHC